MNNKKLVSRVELGLNSVNKDAKISKRYILDVAKSKATFLMAQKFRDRSVFKESNIFTSLTCFELESVDKYSCDIVEFKNCESLMKSVKKLPDLVYTRYGSSILEVTNIDYTKDFKPTTPYAYRKNKSRVEYIPELTHYERDGFLYLPESEVRSVSLVLYTPNSYDAEKLSACKEDKCLNPWDFEFTCSAKVLEVVIQETIKEVSQILRIPEDENPNLDSNIKSKTVI